MTRAFIGLVAVIGIVAMHGLTMNHDAAMPSTDAGHTMSATLPMINSGHDSAMADAPVIGSVPDLAPVVRAGRAAAGAARALTAGSAHSIHAATACCIAYLTGLLLLLGAGRLLGRRRRGRPACELRHDVAWFATAVGRLRPDLAELSVLRT
jgi:hypothetical protein